jgi:hypothetical protein
VLADFVKRLSQPLTTQAVVDTTAKFLPPQQPIAVVAIAILVILVCVTICCFGLFLTRRRRKCVRNSQSKCVEMRPLTDARDERPPQQETGIPEEQVYAPNEIGPQPHADLTADQLNDRKGVAHWP